MYVLIAALIVAAAVLFAARIVAAAPARARRDADPPATHLFALLQLFAPAIAGAEDARVVLAWQPIARAARQLFPGEFATLDRACGGRFPLTPEQIAAVHARWTSEWLTWERAHTSEYARRAAAVEGQLASAPGSPALRAELDAIEREKLDLYQRHYEDYVRVSKALQNLEA